MVGAFAGRPAGWTIRPPRPSKQGSQGWSPHEPCHGRHVRWMHEMNARRWAVKGYGTTVEATLAPRMCGVGSVLSPREPLHNGARSQSASSSVPEAHETCPEGA